MSDDAPTLVLYGRVYCHLCGDMERALQPLLSEFGIGLACVDVDDDPALEERYGELVPVLTLEGKALCHYHLDEAVVRQHLRALIAGIP